MVWPEAPGETGPTTRHLLCAHSRMNSVCRRPWASGIRPDLPPTEAWRTSSDVAPPRSSMVAFRCWLPWDTSLQWLGFAEAEIKIVWDRFNKVCYLLVFPFCNSNIVGWTYWHWQYLAMFFLECIPMKQSPGDHWQIPWLLISIRRFEVRRCA